MKAILVLATVFFSSSLFASQAETITVTTVLNSQESYRLYEFLAVPEVAEQDGRALVKRAGNIVCTRFGYYPGDREYECSVSVTVNKAGDLTSTR